MKYDFDLEEHRFSKMMILKILITLVEAAIVVFGAFAITRYGLETMTVSGEYMSPTLTTGDSIMINKLSYRLHKVHRNDVVVVQQSGSEHSYLTLERVIGLPGETVQIQEGQVYINGKQLDEKFDFPLMENGGMAQEPVTLEKNQYFVLGDNRNECEDSRNATVGNVTKSEIVGKAWLRLNSFTFVGMIDGFRHTAGESDTSE
jgi:signal peptidase I